MKIPELLAPAGNHEKLETALHYGADAVYVGLSGLSLRAKARGFCAEDLGQAVERVHSAGKKIYVTVNVFPHNNDVESIRDHAKLLAAIKPDAVLISDVGTFDIIKETAPELTIHVSTQANITNFKSAQFWERLGAKRLVLARELSIEEIRQIRDNVSAEIECFVHGAICISYSGRCYISAFLAGRSGNMGLCTNSCRWNYTLMEEKRHGQFFPVYEDARGTYMLSSKDLCMINHLDKLAAAGVDSFKIEGRLKGVTYVAVVVKTYREAINHLGSGGYEIKERWLKELSGLSSRGYTTGMYLGPQPFSDYEASADVKPDHHELVGIVESIEGDKILVRLRNNLEIGDEIEFLTTGADNAVLKVTELLDPDRQPLLVGRNENKVVLPLLPGVAKDDLVKRYTA